MYFPWSSLNFICVSLFAVGSLPESQIILVS